MVIRLFRHGNKDTEVTGFSERDENIVRRHLVESGGCVCQTWSKYDDQGNLRRSILKQIVFRLLDFSPFHQNNKFCARPPTMPMRSHQCHRCISSRYRLLYDSSATVTCRSSHSQHDHHVMSPFRVTRIALEALQERYCIIKRCHFCAGNSHTMDLKIRIPNSS